MIVTFNARRSVSPLLLMATVVTVTGCGRAAPEPNPASAEPAHVEGAPVESGLATITLTAEAEARLGIETDTVRRQTVQRGRSYGGVLEVPSGRSFTIVAPVAGTIAPLEGSVLPAPGAPLAADQEVLRLLPVSPPGQDLIRIEAEATARVEAARLQAQRAEQLLRDRAGSQRSLEEARAELAVAEANSAAIRGQLQLLRRTTGPGGVPALALVSPLAARLGVVHVAVGQSVAQSAALFEVFADDPLWIRVPVYVGDVRMIDTTRDAMVRDLGESASGGAPAEARRAPPVSAPPSADPSAATVDLYYELDNPDSSLRPGQKVGVTLLFAGTTTPATEQLVVPRSAIVYDIQGGAWVYERIAPLSYARRRVEVSHVVDDLAVLGRGPEPQTVVVTSGVAELFGTEFGVAH